MTKKSQIASTDLVVSFVIVIISLTLIFLLWGQYYQRLNQNLEYNEMMIKALQASEILLKDSGKPEDWDGKLQSALASGEPLDGPVVEDIKKEITVIGLANQNISFQNLSNPLTGTAVLDKDRKLSKSKLDCLVTGAIIPGATIIDHTKLKQSIVSNYNVYVTIVNATQPYTQIASFGQQPLPGLGEPKRSVNLVRYGMYYDPTTKETTTIRINFVMWK